MSNALNTLKSRYRIAEKLLAQNNHTICPDRKKTVLTVLLDTWFDYFRPLKLAHKADCPKKSHHLSKSNHSKKYICRISLCREKRYSIVFREGVKHIRDAAHIIKTTQQSGFSGAASRNRTKDTGIFRPLLYQLSYRGILYSILYLLNYYFLKVRAIKYFLG